nr:hypothetical protein [Tanacetum cinerariifolium]
RVQQLKASLVTKGITLEDNLVANESTYDFVRSSKQLDKSNNSGNDEDAEKLLVDTVAFDIENADIGPSYESDIVSEIHHDMFENVFAHGIQNHEQPESLPDIYVVDENNRNINSYILNMYPDRDKKNMIM